MDSEAACSACYGRCRAQGRDTSQRPGPAGSQRRRPALCALRSRGTPLQSPCHHPLSQGPHHCRAAWWSRRARRARRRPRRAAAPGGAPRAARCRRHSPAAAAARVQQQRRASVPCCARPASEPGLGGPPVVILGVTLYTATGKALCTALRRGASGRAPPRPPTPAGRRRTRAAPPPAAAAARAARWA